MKIILILIGILTAGYPFFVYWGMQVLEPKLIGLTVVLLYLVRGLIISSEWKKKLLYFALAIIVSGVVWVLNSQTLLKLVPALLNAFMCGVFLYSYLYPPTIPARFAEKFEGKLNEAQIGYTNKVTLVWIGFFVLNGLTALFTALYTSHEVWMLYNGFIAYLLTGALFGLEYLYRVFVFKKKGISSESV